MAFFDSIQALAKTLTSDRLITIHVGTREIPYTVSQVVLCSVSEYFVKAIENGEHMGSGEIGVLRFPVDDEEAWEVILFWMIEKRLPLATLLADSERGSYQSLLFRTWILADKYIMPKMQNAIMTLLLDHLNYNSQAPEAAVQGLWDHTVDSVLGRLACEGLVERAHGGGGDNWVPEDLGILDGIPGAVVAVVRAVERFNEIGEYHVGLLPGGRSLRQWPRRISGSEVWKEYMVPE